jgi:hypothetical protein
MLLFGISLADVALWQFSQGNSFGMVMIGFGVGSVLLVRQDYRIYKGNIQFKHY